MGNAHYGRSCIASSHAQEWAACSWDTWSAGHGIWDPERRCRISRLPSRYANSSVWHAVCRMASAKSIVVILSVLFFLLNSCLTVRTPFVRSYMLSFLPLYYRRPILLYLCSVVSLELFLLRSLCDRSELGMCQWSTRR